MSETIKLEYGINQPEKDILVIHIKGLGYDVKDASDWEILDTTIKTVITELYAHKNKIKIKTNWSKVDKYPNPHNP